MSHDQFPVDDLDERSDAERYAYEREKCLEQTQAALAKMTEAERRARAHAAAAVRWGEMWRKSELAMQAELKELRLLAEQAVRATTPEEQAALAALLCARLVRDDDEPPMLDAEEMEARERG